jgi:hypothetical protein
MPDCGRANMKPFLTVPETCIWAATRSPEAVDALTDRAREGIHTLLDPEGTNDAPGAAWKAFKALDDLCATGELTMHGVEHGTGASGPIPADAWAKLALVTIARWGLVAARRGSEMLDPGARWWNDLTIRSADALKIWPPREETELPVDDVTVKASAATQEPPSPPIPDVRVIDPALLAEKQGKEHFGWMMEEVGRLFRLSEPRDRDTMVVAVRNQFPDSKPTVEKARAMYYKLPEEIRSATRGRPKGSRNSGHK